MPRILSLALASVLGLSLMACSSARIVRDTASGGTVAMRGPDGSAREKAEKLMVAKCPNGYAVVEQGEVPYGESYTNYGSYGRPSGFGITTGSSTQKTEWQIVFQCKNAQASAQPYVIRF